MRFLAVSMSCLYRVSSKIGCFIRQMTCVDVVCLLFICTWFFAHEICLLFILFYHVLHKLEELIAIFFGFLCLFICQLQSAFWHPKRVGGR